MISQGIDRDIFSNASRRQAADWIATTWREFPVEIIRNSSWCKSGLSYFLDE